jgi:hypothetical protein
LRIRNISSLLPHSYCRHRQCLYIDHYIVHNRHSPAHPIKPVRKRRNTAMPVDLLFRLVDASRRPYSAVPYIRTVPAICRRQAPRTTTRLSMSTRCAQAHCRHRRPTVTDVRYTNVIMWLWSRQTNTEHSNAPPYGCLSSAAVSTHRHTA